MQEGEMGAEHKLGGGLPCPPRVYHHPPPQVDAASGAGRMGLLSGEALGFGNPDKLSGSLNIQCVQPGPASPSKPP